MNIESIDPENISEEQEHWKATAEGLLKNLLWQIETGQLKPKELIVICINYKDGIKRSLLIESTNHDKIKIHGMLHLALSRHADKFLYRD